MNDTFFFSAPQLKRDPLGGLTTDLPTPELGTRPQLPPRRGGSRGVLFAIVLVYLTPLGFLIYSQTSSHANQSRASRSFAPVVATVVESGVARRGRRSGWLAKITYRYQVDGQTYVSSRISFAATSTSGLLRGGPSREGAAAAASEHPVGSTIDAYYDPADPSEAVRDVAPPAGSPLLPILWLLVLAALFALLQTVPRNLGPQIPDPVVTGGILVGGLGALVAGAWYLNRAVRGSGGEDAGTAFAFGLIGMMILYQFVRRVRARRV